MFVKLNKGQEFAKRQWSKGGADSPPHCPLPIRIKYGYFEARNDNVYNK